MRKYAVASHGKLATGVESTLELFMGHQKAITYIDAYTEGTADLEQQVNTFLKSVTIQDEAIIFTDIYGGSVNQKITLLAKNQKNIHIIAGFNMSLLLELMVSQEQITDDYLDQTIEKARAGMLRVKYTSEADEDDENFFDNKEEEQ